jgi:hypothetical protein
MRRIFFVAAIVAFPALAEARTWVIPHVLEKSGTTVVATYTGGLPGMSGQGRAEATLNVFLYARDGRPMTGADRRPLCNPCAYPLSAGVRTHEVDLTALARRASPESARHGFAVVASGGGDAASVNLQGFITNSNIGELSVFGFQPEEVRAPSL